MPSCFCNGYHGLYTREQDNNLDAAGKKNSSGFASVYTDTPLTGLASSSHASFSRWENHGAQSG